MPRRTEHKDGTAFQVGDFVQLKSGGPKMTVAGYDAYSGEIYCKWFAGQKLQEGAFSEDSLQKYKEEKIKKGKG